MMWVSKLSPIVVMDRNQINGSGPRSSGNNLCGAVQLQHLISGPAASCLRELLVNSRVLSDGCGYGNGSGCGWKVGREGLRAGYVSVSNSWARNQSFGSCRSVARS